MAADSLVIITVEGSNHRIAAWAAYHRSMPEVRGEADCPESALDRLAERLVLDLDCISDDFHRDLVRSALGDVDRARSGH
jgi:hypothetical protein